MQQPNSFTKLILIHKKLQRNYFSHHGVET